MPFSIHYISLEFKPLTRLAVSIATLEVVEHLMVVSDLFVVGKMGEKEFAAVGLAGVYFWVFILIAMSLLSAIGVITAQARAAKRDRSQLSRCCAQGFWVVWIMSLLFGLVVWFMADLLKATSVDPILLPIVKEYTHALVYALPFAVLFVWLRNYFSGLEFSKPITLIALIAAPANLALNYVLVFGILGWAGLGVKGAGYGTSIINFLMFAFLLHTLYRHDKSHFMDILRYIKMPDLALIGRIFRIGTGPAVVALLENGMFAVVSLLAGMISVTALAAHNLVFTVLEMGVLIAVGIGEASMIRVAYHIGNKDALKIKATLWLSLILGAVLMCFCAVIIASYPEFFLNLIIEGDAKHADSTLIVIQSFVFAAALSLVFDGSQTILNRVLRATEDEIYPVVIAIVGYWGIGLGSAYVLGFCFNDGIAGVWYGLTLGFFITSLLMAVRFYKRCSTLIGKKPTTQEIQIEPVK